MNPRTLSIAADGWTGAPAITTRQQIFAPAKPAPGVVPDGIAMDAAPGDITGWAAAGQYGEGISFVGYAYLAELAQRPEYRRISETIAKEMTRKWVKLVSTGDDDKSDHIKALTDAMDRYRLQDAAWLNMMVFSVVATYSLMSARVPMLNCASRCLWTAPRWLRAR